jgi:hypothetical protein
MKEEEEEVRIFVFEGRGKEYSMVGIPGQYKHTKHFFGLAGKGIQEKIS